jgi:putative N6-adenine-specific DNA methylase
MNDVVAGASPEPRLKFMPNATTYLIFAQTAPGLEGSLESELSGLGISPRRKTGGVEFRGTEQDLWRVCLLSRQAESVRLRLKPFSAKGFDALQKELRKLPFSAFLPKETQVALKVVCHKSRLWHSGAVEERVRQVLVDHVGLVVCDTNKSPSGEASPASTQGEAPLLQRLHVRLMDDVVQVSIDASGERLHRRGIRKHVERASLRETLAATLFSAAWERHPRAAVLWDPFCGAGTIPLEALSWGRGRVAASQRTFAFEQFRGHDPEAFQAFREHLGEEWAQAAPAPGLRAFASDISPEAVQATESNLREGGVREGAELITGDIEDVAKKVPIGAMIVTNPPYGKRLADGEALVKLRRVLKARPDLRPCLVLVGGPAQRSLGSAAPSLFQTKNGGLSVSARLLQE